MRCRLFGLITLLALMPALWADDEKPKDKDKKEEKKPATPAEDLKTIQNEFRTSIRSAQKAFQEAKSEEDQAKIRKEFEEKKAPTFANHAIELAKNNSKDKIAFAALTFALQIANGRAEGDRALDLILQDHAGNDEVVRLCQMIGGQNTPSSEKLLRAFKEKSTNHKVQGQAAASLGQILKGRTDQLKGTEADKLAAEAEKLFVEVEEKYKDVQGLVEQIKGDFFELRNLRIGKVAPDISGEDGDGKKFKLSDYRGKVVVLDFWAKW
jgi:hypothetical protein